MAKFTPKTIQNLSNQNTAVAQINYNFETLQIIIDTLLSRDGKTPNTMQSALDMNNNRILNLPVPISAQEPARHGDIQQYVDQAEAWAGVSEGFADDSEASAIASALSAAEADADLKEFQSEYLGAFTEDPVLDKNGNAIKDGAFYYNSSDATIRVLSIQNVVIGLDNVVAGIDNVLVNLWITLPVVNFEQLEDTDVSAATNGDWLVWTGNQVLPVTPVATYIAQNNALYDGSTIQDALDDLTTRTSLGIYDISFWASGLMENAEVLFRLVASRTFWVPVGGVGSVANSRVAANAETVLSLKKNGVQFGTITYDATEDDGVFTVAGETVFSPGDILTIESPALADTALRDTSITLACRR